MSRANVPGRSSRHTAGLLASVMAAAVVLASCSTGGGRTTQSAGDTAGASSPASSTVADGGSAGVPVQPATGSETYRPAEPSVPGSGTADGSRSPAAGETAPTSAPAPTTEAAPAAITPVAPPTAGDINQTVADLPVTSLPPVPVTQAGDFGTGVTGTVDSLERIDAVGRGPGERSGPALSYRLSLRNDTGQALDLSTVSVNVQDAAGTPFSAIDNDPAVPFTGSLAPGQTATATYVFTLPIDYTAPATLSLAYSATAPIVLFAGDAQ